MQVTGSAQDPEHGGYSISGSCHQSYKEGKGNARCSEGPLGPAGLAEPSSLHAGAQGSCPNPWDLTQGCRTGGLPPSPVHTPPSTPRGAAKAPACLPDPETTEKGRRVCTVERGRGHARGKMDGPDADRAGQARVVWSSSPTDLAREARALAGGAPSMMTHLDSSSPAPGWGLASVAGGGRTPGGGREAPGLCCPVGGLEAACAGDPLESPTLVTPGGFVCSPVTVSAAAASAPRPFCGSPWHGRPRRRR